MARSVPEGTYHQTVEFAASTAHHIIFLRASGRFLAIGYWRGYERSVAAGDWSESDGDVMLSGKGNIATDDDSSPPSDRYARRFLRAVIDGIPALRAEEELPGWSLLSHCGPLLFCGPEGMIADPASWLPKTPAEVDQWIDRIIPNGPRDAMPVSAAASASSDLHNAPRLKEDEKDDDDDLDNDEDDDDLDWEVDDTIEPPTSPDEPPDAPSVMLYFKSTPTERIALKRRVEEMERSAAGRFRLAWLRNRVGAFVLSVTFWAFLAIVGGSGFWIWGHTEGALRIIQFVVGFAVLGGVLWLTITHERFNTALNGLWDRWENEEQHWLSARQRCRQLLVAFRADHWNQ